MTLTIASIVEGHSEAKSVPILLRRILTALGRSDVQIARPFRVKRNRVVREQELERVIQLIVSDRANVSCILVLLDADNDCPAQLGRSLLERCRKSTELPVAVVLANREFEAWFLAAKESLWGVRGIRHGSLPPAEPEQVQGAKEALTANMEDRRYLEVDDQPAFAKKIDLDAPRQKCPSFHKFCRDVERLLKEALAHT